MRSSNASIATGLDCVAEIIADGSLLDRAMCEDLAARRVSSVQISLDGRPDVHNRYRPSANGGPTFDRIVENLHHAVDFFDVQVRVNIDGSHAHRATELLDVLVDEGFDGDYRPRWPAWAREPLVALGPGL